MRNRLMALALTATMFLLPVVVAKADDDTKPKTKLKVGDPAPELKASKWLQGSEVKSFEPGKVYVVEFWATWCGPCIVMMPHMGDLQDQFKGKATLIGFSAKDPNNTEEAVSKFVEKRGKKLGYTFAFADNRDSYNAWQTAAGQRGIPSCFVVDQKGKIAWIGHPMYLDMVLPKVVDGKWDIEKDVAAVKDVEKQVSELFMATRDNEKFLEKLTEFEKANPKLDSIPYFQAPKLMAMVEGGKSADAKKAAEKLMEKARKRDDSTVMRTISTAFRGPKADDDLKKVALKAAEEMVAMAGDKDPLSLYNLAETHFALGDKEKAKEAGKKALDNAEERMKPFLKKQLERYEK